MGHSHPRVRLTGHSIPCKRSFPAQLFRQHLRRTYTPLSAIPDQALYRPCVDLIDADEYGEIVGQARAFLSGRSQDVQALSKKWKMPAKSWISKQRRFTATDPCPDPGVRRIRTLMSDRLTKPILSPRTRRAVRRAKSSSIAPQNYGTRTYFPTSKGDQCGRGA